MILIRDSIFCLFENRIAVTAPCYKIEQGVILLWQLILISKFGKILFLFHIIFCDSYKAITHQCLQIHHTTFLHANSKVNTTRVVSPFVADHY
jgi:hypothetical protein